MIAILKLFSFLITKCSIPFYLIKSLILLFLFFFYLFSVSNGLSSLLILSSPNLASILLTNKSLKSLQFPVLHPLKPSLIPYVKLMLLTPRLITIFKSLLLTTNLKVSNSPSLFGLTLIVNNNLLMSPAKFSSIKDLLLKPKNFNLKILLDSFISMSLSLI